MTNEELLKLAYTRELTDERVRIAAAYWLDCSPHEQTTADGVILARYARYAMELLAEKELTITSLQKQLSQSNACAAHWACLYHAEETRFQRQNTEIEQLRSILNEIKVGDPHAGQGG
jgi:protoporphyrinogen oxidase